MRLLKLDQRVQDLLIDECISSGHARALLALTDLDEQFEIATRIFDEKLSVRETEKLIKQINKRVIKKEKQPLENGEIYSAIEERLKESIGSKVVINRKDNHKGKIEIDYYSADELDRIIGLITK